MKKVVGVLVITLAVVLMLAAPAFAGHALLNLFDPPANAVEAWWRWIYIHLMGGNTVMMFLFGWELFLMGLPISLLITIVQAIF